MPPPLPRRSVWAYRFAHCIQTYQSSTIGLSGRPAHCPFRGLLGVHSRCGLHTRAVTNLRHANRRLQPLRYLHDCSDCFRLERLPGGACTHWKAPPLHGAHPTRTSRGWLASLEIRCPRSFRVLICPCVRLSQRLPCVALRGPCLTQGSLAWIAQGNVFA